MCVCYIYKRPGLFKIITKIKQTFLLVVLVLLLYRSMIIVVVRLTQVEKKQKHDSKFVDGLTLSTHDKQTLLFIIHGHAIRTLSRK